MLNRYERYCQHRKEWDGIGNLSTHLNIRVCHGCSYRIPPDPLDPKGLSPCGADDRRRDTVELAELHACPAGKFPWRGFGDLAAWAIHLLRLQVLAHWWRRLTGKPCRCGERQAKLNTRFAGAWEWLGKWRP